MQTSYQVLAYSSYLFLCPHFCVSASVDVPLSSVCSVLSRDHITNAGFCSSWVWDQRFLSASLCSLPLFNEFLMNPVALRHAVWDDSVLLSTAFSRNPISLRGRAKKTTTNKQTKKNLCHNSTLIQKVRISYRVFFSCTLIFHNKMRYEVKSQSQLQSINTNYTQITLHVMSQNKFKYKESHNSVPLEIWSCFLAKWRE